MMWKLSCSITERRNHGQTLDEKTAELDDVVDQIVYSLYDLTEEEIAIVEASVGNNS